MFRLSVNLLKTNKFYSIDQINGLISTINLLPTYEMQYGYEIKNFHFIQPGLSLWLKRMLGENISLNENSGTFRKPFNFIHFEEFDSPEEWRFVVAIKPTIFSVFFHKSGVKSALEKYNFNYRNFLDWDYHTNILLEPGEGIFYRPWIFHSFTSEMIQHYQMQAHKQIETKIILVMGLSGNGKTTFAKELSKELNATHLNADEIRSIYNDWDFSFEGRERQAIRMRRLAEEATTEYVVIDMIAPRQSQRDILSPDFIIWINTKAKSKYEDTDTIFEPPKANIIVTSYDYNVKQIIKELYNFFTKTNDSEKLHAI